MFRIIQKRKIWFVFSGTLVMLSLVSLIFWGLNLGIDFTGGSLLEIKFKQTRPELNQIRDALAELELSNINIQSVDQDGILIRTVSLSEEQHQSILRKIDTWQSASLPTNLPAETNSTNNQLSAQDLGLEGEGLENLQIQAVNPKGDEISFNTIDGSPSSTFTNIEELRFDSIGPLIGNELKQKAIYAVIIVLIAIIAYIAYAFRKASYPVESWKYGLAAIIALVHDILIIIGVFSVLGHFANVQIDSYFVTAILTVLGFSVHDTIVTFDRTRENLKRRQDKTFEEVINLSINETLIRSINTSLTTFFALLSIFLFGGETIKYFALALMLGAIVGTYSSIFLASPLLLIWYKLKKY